MNSFLHKSSKQLLTITGKNNKKDYQQSTPHIKVSAGESVRIIRELQELSQNRNYSPHRVDFPS